ncbi:MAG: nuclear transport factor 2 family protein [Pseudomonadota bacterium]
MDLQIFVDRWHNIVDNKRMDLMEDLLDDNAVLISPVVHTPLVGKETTAKYLTAARHVFVNDSFEYTRVFRGVDSVVFEFETMINDISVNGVDMITLSNDGKITEFRVMVRPLKAVNLIHNMMGSSLQEMEKDNQ